MKIYSLIIILFLVGCATTRPWTATEKIMLGASCLAMVADMSTTLNGLHNGNYELNPIMGKYPSDGKVVIAMVGSQFLTIILAHYWEDFRIWILGIKTGVNAGFAFHNTRID